MSFSLGQFVVNTARFHIKGNLAVLMGIVIATASLTGALLVGDSLRGSLADTVKNKLIWVNEVVLAQRFFNEQIVVKLGEKTAIPAIILKASIQVRDDQDCLVTQISSAQVVAVPEEFWQDEGKSAQWKNLKGAWLNHQAAIGLKISEKQNVVLRIEKPSAIPRESFLGNREDVVDSITLEVEKVLDRSDKYAGFNLFPGMDVPATIFVPLKLVQEKLGITSKINSILTSKSGMQDKFRSLLTFSDYELTFKGPEERVLDLFAKFDRDKNQVLEKREYQGKMPAKLIPLLQSQAGTIDIESVQKFFRANRNYYSLESSQMLVSPNLAQKADDLIQEMGLQSSQIMVYLANNIQEKNNAVPYSVIAGIDATLQKKLGVKLAANEKSGEKIWLLDWNESPLKPAIGDPVGLEYFLPEVVGKPIEKKDSFQFAGYIPADINLVDPEITPDFPGITDKLSLDSWNPPFPYDNKRIKPRDEKYWQDFRSVPKAFIDLDAAKSLWGSRFGKITSIRVYPTNLSFPTGFAADFQARLLKSIDPTSVGFVFQDLRARFQQSSQSGTDFSGLFVGFSFFLILSALILVALLFRLHLERRASQVGTVLALGATQKQVAHLLLLEGLLVAGLGVLLGLGVACVYAIGLLQYLKSNWPDNSLQQILKLHIPFKTLCMGFVLAFIMSAVAIFRTSRTLVKTSVMTLIKGGYLDSTVLNSKQPLSLLIYGSLFMMLGFGMLFLPSSQDHELKALKFFGAGGLVLTSGLFFLGAFLRYVHKIMVFGHGFDGLARLALRNMARNKTRSLLTAGLLSSAAFLIIAVEPFRKEADSNTGKNSGTGGFSIVVETNIPVLSGLDGLSGIETILDGVLKSNRGNPQRARQQVDRFKNVLKDVKVFSLRFNPGDDASCLNLFAPSKPRILGVPNSLQQRGGFLFSATTEASENPWKLLDSSSPFVNAFVEKNTVEWMIHSGLGRDYKIQDASGKDELLKFAGLFQGSVFQSEILIGESQFLKFYPQQQGYQYFLIDADSKDLSEIEEAFKIGLSDYGAKVSKTKDLIERFASVENAYLSMFQGLGTIGLLIGTMGVAAVLARSVWERRAELGLLSALGFTQVDVVLVMLLEHALLLFLGLGIGTLAALVSVLPLEHSTATRWGVLALLQGGMFFFGLMVCVASLWSIRTNNFVAAMRKE
jgi:ABC-type antimicrobial peptide transport system permease subunit